MKPMKTLGAVVVMLGCVGAWAQSDDDALFDDPQPVVTSTASTTTDVAANFLGAVQKTTLTGAFRYEATVDGVSADPAVAQKLILDLGLTARPTSDVRIGAKGAWTSDPSTGESSFHVSEAFADFQAGSTLYVRAGKQFIGWGRGRYFSPADVLSLSAIDPNNPTAAREGPTSAKARLELGTGGSYEGVISAEGVKRADDVSYALQGNWVLAGNELSLGGFFQPSKQASPRVFATTAFKVLGINWYTESVAMWGNDSARVEDDGHNGLQIASASDELVSQHTIGGTLTLEDKFQLGSLMLLGQYYYNGTGVADAALYRDRKAALGPLIAQGKLGPGDLSGYSQHYAAGTVLWSKLFETTVSVSATALASLTEQSVTVIPNLSWVVTPLLTVGASATLQYGPEFAEYSRWGTSGSWKVEAHLFDHLDLSYSDALPDFGDDFSPVLKVSFSGLSF